MPLSRNRGIFRVFSPALDLEKTAFLTIKTARTGNVSSGRLLSQDFCFFRLLTVRRRKTQTVGKYRFQQLVGECFCAVGIEKQLRNNGLPVPLCRDNSVRLSQWGRCSFLFCQSVSPFSGRKRGTSRSSENPSLMLAILFYGADSAAAACAFFFARYSRALIRSYSRCFSRFLARYSLE